MSATSQVEVLVDVDNLAFQDSKLDERCLARRLETLSRELGMGPERFVLFCNTVTHKFLQVNCAAIFGSSEVPSRVVVTGTEKDSADHALLAWMERSIKSRRSSRKLKIVIVTSDKTLARVARFLHASHRLRGCSSKGEARTPFDELQRDPACTSYLEFWAFNRRCSIAESSRPQDVALDIGDAHAVKEFMDSLNLYNKRRRPAKTSSALSSKV